MSPWKLSSTSLLSVVVAVLIKVPGVSAHGYVREVVLGSEAWPGYNPFVDSYVISLHIDPQAFGLMPMEVVGASSAANHTKDTWNWYDYSAFQKLGLSICHSAPVEDLTLIEWVEPCVPPPTFPTKNPQPAV